MAVVDALGFRGIWRRHKSESVYEDIFASLQAARHAATTTNVDRIFLPKDFRIKATAFSDTIILVDEVLADGEPGHIGDRLRHVTRAVAELQMTAARGKIPLAYRGSIAVGELALGDDAYVGEAIDEAAEWYEQADAAVVVLAPSARRCIASLPETTAGHKGLLVTAEVAFKAGGSKPLTVPVVNPLWTMHVLVGDFRFVEARVDAAAADLLRPFDSSMGVDVERKRQNTERFLRTAKSRTLEVFKTLHPTLDDEAEQ